MPIVSGGTPATAQLTSRANGVSPSSAASSACVTMQTAAPSFCPLELPAVTVASGSERPITGRSAARPSSVVSGRGCSSRSISRVPALRGGHRALMGEQAQLVLLLTRDGVFTAKVLGGLQHAAADGVAGAAGRHAPAGQAVLQHRAARPGSRAQPRAVQLGLTHALGATGHD